MRRCSWCQRWVRADAEPVAWAARVHRAWRQRPDSEWNLWARLLCPDCQPVTRRRTSFWRPVPVALVARLRPEGLVAE